ncbi:MAG: metallopeptidase TldD-related protein [Actinomycetota bacterium]|nr:metallopeptidase TldD-related protein [Actinomycetota bacterium]MDQ3574380.1 metallopeptidase TldD-related protein [Actinomycetota bacterium]
MSPLPETAEQVLSLSRADDCIVVAKASASANARWANNTSTTNGLVDTTAISIVSVIDERVGTVSSTHFPDERLESLVRRSEAACAGKPKADDYMPLLAEDGQPADWESPATTEGAEVFTGFGPALGQAMERAEGQGIRLFGYAEHGTTTTWLATSGGLRRRHTQPAGRVELNAKTSDLSRSTWAGRATTGALADVDVSGMYEHLVQRLEWSAATVELPPRDYQVLLEPSAVADMLIYAYWASSAREADEGRTVFSKPGGGSRIGERLYPSGLTVYSDPYETGLEVTPFSTAVASSSYSSVFDCGLPQARTEWVSDGVLRALITTRHWAQRSGGGKVTPLIGNLVLASESGPTLEEMIAATDRALLVTCFWYIRQVDPQTLLLTGLTRDGVFLVEDGKVKGAVNNFRYNMSPVRMLAQVREVGRSQPTLPREFGDYFSFAKMPPLRVDDFHMSSVSEAV